MKLVLSGGDTGNFVCPTFPAELGRFPALTVLDWTSNGQVGEHSRGDEQGSLQLARAFAFRSDVRRVCVHKHARRYGP